MELDRDLRAVLVGLDGQNPESGLRQARAMVIVHPRLQIHETLQIMLGVIGDDHRQLTGMVQVHPVVSLTGGTRSRHQLTRRESAVHMPAG